jgi:hypothetical protein
MAWYSAGLYAVLKDKLVQLLYHRLVLYEASWRIGAKQNGKL